jgi:hypothetical protein
MRCNWGEQTVPHTKTDGCGLKLETLKPDARGKVGGDVVQSISRRIVGAQYTQHAVEAV